MKNLLTNLRLLLKIGKKEMEKFAWFLRWKALAKTISCFYAVIILMPLFAYENYNYSFGVIIGAWFFLCIITPLPYAFWSFQEWSIGHVICKALIEFWDNVGEKFRNLRKD